MPIIVPVNTQGGPAIPRVMEAVPSLDFRSLDGSQLVTWDGDEWIPRAGLTGVDRTPIEVLRDREPGLPGSRISQVSDLERDVIMPVRLRAGDQSQTRVRDMLRALRRVSDHRRVNVAAEDGAFDLVARLGDQERSLRVTLVEGLEGDYSSGQYYAGGWQILALHMLAVDPYWRGDLWSTPVVRPPAGVTYLDDDGNPGFSWTVVPASALGSAMPVPVTGDVDSSWTLTLTSPWTQTRVRSPQGISVTVGAVLQPGRTFRLDTGRRVRALLDGQDAWDLVADPVLTPPLPPGEALVTIEMDGAAATSSAVLSGVSRWESWIG